MAEVKPMNNGNTQVFVQSYNFKIIPFQGEELVAFQIIDDDGNKEVAIAGALVGKLFIDLIAEGVYFETKPLEFVDGFVPYDYKELTPIINDLESMQTDTPIYLELKKTHKNLKKNLELHGLYGPLYFW